MYNPYFYNHSISRKRIKHYHKELILAIVIFFLFSFSFNSEMKAQTQIFSGMNFFGDFRLRYENTSNAEPNSTFLQGRNREVVRFRAGFTKKISDMFNFGVRLATGSSDDPNSTDVTLSDFVNDFEISLDKLYIEMNRYNFSLSAGKFANPFQRTDLVWDGDVNPQGLAGSYTFKGSKFFIPKISGMYFIIDEHTSTNIPESEMLGAQLQLTSHPVEDLTASLACGYYNYNLGNLSSSTAGSGDIRSNNIDILGPDNVQYTSDFNLLDVIAVCEYKRLGEYYPIKLVIDYVNNLGANVVQDQGFGIDIFLGRGKQKNDFRFGYGYSQAGTDAVLAAFSHDNTTIATNYIQHTLTCDYVILENMTLNLTWYIYKYKTVRDFVSNEFISRLRLNAIVTL
jgi:hypothetical protein